MAEFHFDAIAGEMAEDVNREHRFSFFPSIASTAPLETTIGAFWEQLASGEYSDMIAKLRAEPNAKKQSALKRNLPCVTFSGVFVGGHALKNLVGHSGLICLDFDAERNPLISGHAADWRDKLADDPFVKLAFVSARGNGVAVVVRIEPERHDQAFDALCAYFRGTYGVMPDKGCRDVTRLRFVSWDDAAKGNPHARLFRRYGLANGVQEFGSSGVQNHSSAIESHRTQSNVQPSAMSHQPLTRSRREEILSALERVSPDNRDTWLQIGMAIQSEADTLEGFNLWRRWSEFNDAAGKFNAPDLDRVWRSFGRRHGVRIETLFKLAYTNQWTGPPHEQRADGLLPTLHMDEWMKTQPKPRDPIVENVFDSGTFVELIAPSKCRKSYFALQLANCIATGTKFLAWTVPRPRKVLLINVELIADREHDRESAMIHGLGIQPAELSRLEIANIRGVKLENPVAAICATIREKRPDVCIVDPLYLIHGEDENDQRNMTALFQELSVTHVAANCALVVVHHDAKGKPGDREKRDRGSGTGIMGRFSDSRILLTPHRDDPDGLICVETLCRYFPPQPAITCRFEENRLVMVDDVEAAPQTSRNTRTVKTETAIEDAVNVLIADIIANGPFTSSALRMKMYSKERGGLGLMTNNTKQAKCFEQLKKKASEPGSAFSFVQIGNSVYFGTHEHLHELVRPKVYKDD